MAYDTNKLENVVITLAPLPGTNIGAKEISRTCRLHVYVLNELNMQPIFATGNLKIVCRSQLTAAQLIYYSVTLPCCKWLNYAYLCYC